VCAKCPSELIVFAAWNTGFRQAACEARSLDGARWSLTIEKANVLRNGAFFLFTSRNGDEQCLVMDLKREMAFEKMLHFFFC
jgi:hypothetical protein